MNKSANAQGRNIRWKLLTTVSVMALVGAVTGEVHAADADRPLVWIELGGQLSRLDDGQEAFAPPFVAAIPAAGFTSPLTFERSARYSLDDFGSISFQPDGSDWIFSASVRYGRSSSNKDVHEQTNPTKLYYWPPPFSSFFKPFKRGVARFSETTARNSESHIIADFQAAKDVGLGMFGNGGSSVLALGVRFAQFGGKSRSNLKADTDAAVGTKYFTSYYGAHLKLPHGTPYHSNLATFSAKRSFHGVGPSISWKASASLAGSTQDGQLAVDWGANAALLFGRQRTVTHHQTTGYYAPPKYNRAQTYQSRPPASVRARAVTVPNLGGFVGLSYRIEDFKVSFGYRADMFFGAIDGGIDTRKSENRGFNGPFASMSVGLGD